MQSSAHLGYLNRNIIKINRCQRECMSRALHHHHRREHTATVTENNFLVAKPNTECVRAHLFLAHHKAEKRAVFLSLANNRETGLPHLAAFRTQSENQGT
ncbi:hypothetical protein CEXT_391381 [Caerostris extrusa]|uniref:Uncharacterized protein n=1 Tax=Caerostris extrusa TaxID=172846 RepID=A0AAV4VG27_CAEEX|nr:hypothetical protein CEXT_391381 [Caerostris extrusa]